MDLSRRPRNPELTDFKAANRLAMNLVVDDMLSGKQRPTIAEGLAASRFLAAVDEAEGPDIDTENVTRAFLVYWQAIRKHCSPQVVQAIAREVQCDPIMVSLVRKTMRDGDVLEDQRPGDHR